MAHIELAAKVFDDFDRFLDHMARFNVENAPQRIAEIMQAIDILRHSPLIGRPVKGGNRELIIGRESHGYIALYRYAARLDTAFILAIRSQREGP